MSDSEKVIPHVVLFTDGACIGNPGPGGWAFILKHPASGRTKEQSGGEHDTTNNRMELMAVIRGLEALKARTKVDLHSDSKYVVQAISEWLPRWKRNGWKKSPHAKESIKNADLWKRLDELISSHEIHTHWVKGHAGHYENEKCDTMATNAASRIAATPRPPPQPTQPKLDQLF